jgi:hypothetical protein
MLKQVIFWCAVFVVAVISAVLIGEMGGDPAGRLQPGPLVSTAAHATEQSGASEQSNASPKPNVAEAAEPERTSDR